MILFGICFRFLWVVFFSHHETVGVVLSLSTQPFSTALISNTELPSLSAILHLFYLHQVNQRVSRKLRPRKLRPQTRKTQTLGCLENSDLEKTQTLGCLETSDPKNSDPWMSRKLRPEKLRPSGCLENSDPKNKTYLHRVNAASRLVYCSLIQWH